jgi:hypothetical protein
MSTVFRISLTIAAMASAIPAAAQAPAAATFNGIYVGVSTTASPERVCTPAQPVPSTLTIENGVARTAAGFEGTVTAGGDLELKNSAEIHTNGHVDNQGNVTATTKIENCTFETLWRKQ